MAVHVQKHRQPIIILFIELTELRLNVLRIFKVLDHFLHPEYRRPHIIIKVRFLYGGLSVEPVQIVHLTVETKIPLIHSVGVQHWKNYKNEELSQYGSRPIVRSQKIFDETLREVR